MEIESDYSWGGSVCKPLRDGDANIWARSKMSCLFFDKKLNSQYAYIDYPCCVKFRQGEIEISYFNDPDLGSQSGNIAVYKGKDMGDGHYYLWNGKNGAKKGNARMHLARSNVLEGSWEEDIGRGMWMITLKRGL
jgi:hypothetical protein